MRIQPLSSAIRSTVLVSATAALAFALPFKHLAQNDLTIHVDGLSNDTVYLANYYGAKLFYNDTAVTDKNGTVVFTGKPFAEGGKYAVVVPGPKFFEFLMVDEPMEFKTTADDPSGNVEVIQSKENDVFFGYLEFLKDKREKRAPFDAVLRDSFTACAARSMCRCEAYRVRSPEFSSSSTQESPPPTLRRCSSLRRLALRPCSPGSSPLRISSSL